MTTTRRLLGSLLLPLLLAAGCGSATDRATAPTQDPPAAGPSSRRVDLTPDRCSDAPPPPVVAPADDAGECTAD